MISCGHCHQKHASAAEVRACSSSHGVAPRVRTSSPEDPERTLERAEAEWLRTPAYRRIEPQNALHTKRPWVDVDVFNERVTEDYEWLDQNRERFLRNLDADIDPYDSPIEYET